MSDRLAEMFARQYAQQASIHGSAPLSRDMARSLAAEFAQYGIGEMYSYLDSIAYKRFLTAEEMPRRTRLTEWIDAFKYLLAIGWTEGFTAREVYEEFMRKSEVVDHRRAQVKMSTHVAGFDIDGVLCEYDMWEPDEETFIERGGVTTLAPNMPMIEFAQELKKDGWTIIVVTARKLYRHSRLEADTYEWLQSAGMPYDKVLWGYDKMEQIRRFGAEFRFFVEDSMKHAIDIATSGIPVYLIGADPGVVSFDRARIPVIPVPDADSLITHFLENFEAVDGKAVL